MAQAAGSAAGRGVERPSVVRGGTGALAHGRAAGLPWEVLRIGHDGGAGHDGGRT